jgi:hypothetical protein
MYFKQEAHYRVLVDALCPRSVFFDKLNYYTMQEVVYEQVSTARHL